MLSRSFVVTLAFVAVHCGGSMDSNPNPTPTPNPDDCTALLQQQKTSCSVEGEKCESPAQSCSNQTLYCTCENGKFFCEAPQMNCGTCPSPDQVTEGAACTLSVESTCPSTTGYTDCNGNFQNADCNCMNGTWQCPTSPPWQPCAVDGGGAD